ncbi:uncharacterized protein LOC133547071 isoform X1 [Nerophis ophidion]|uniref:uncharacterized protein LOC133547071 isoform X1 n=1 Tax=Nerophis ophidion TaxID=159077 RepID=UPI002ADF3AAB|nr:uncharacterized protein LOC133547071 isoform X1 [Nerophis ophidion]
MAPQDRGVCQVITDLRADRDHRGHLEPRVHLELQDQMGQQDPRGIKDFLVLVASKETKEKEVTCNPQQPCALSHAKYVSSSFRATCPATTPSSTRSQSSQPCPCARYQDRPASPVEEAPQDPRENKGPPAGLVSLVLMGRVEDQETEVHLERRARGGVQVLESKDQGDLLDRQVCQARGAQAARALSVALVTPGHLGGRAVLGPPDQLDLQDTVTTTPVWGIMLESNLFLMAAIGQTADLTALPRRRRRRKRKRKRTRTISCIIASFTETWS